MQVVALNTTTTRRALYLLGELQLECRLHTVIGAFKGHGLRIQIQ